MNETDNPASSNSGQARVCVACGSTYSSDTRFCPIDGKPLRAVASAQADADPLIGTVIGERYIVERKIGEGGMGVVYEAEHILMQRRCALKVLKPDKLNKADSIARFSREARNSARISHPNVATVYDFGTHGDDLMYIAMEYVSGVALSSLLRSEGTLSARRAAVIALQIAEGLEAAHALSIVHRDLKPDNVLLARSDDGSDVVKVIDFGIARAMSDAAQRVTSTSAMIGTPAYMSTEQLTGAEVDSRSDIYSLALVCYSMLTGSLPFGSSHSELLLRFLQSPRPLLELDSSIPWPAELQDVLNRALASSPNERFQSAADFAAAFSEAIAPLAETQSEARVARTPSNRTPTLAAIIQSRHISLETPRPRLPAVAVRRRAFIGLGIISLVATGLLIAVNLPRTAGDNSSTISTSPPAPRADSSNLKPLVAPTSEGAKSGAVQRSVPDAGNTTPVSGRTGAARTNNPSAPDSAALAAAARLDSTRIADSLRMIAARESANTRARAAEPPPTHGLVLLGSFGSTLYVNGENKGPLRALTIITVPVGDGVTIRLHTDNCENWDTVINVSGRDTVRIGNRRPRCGNPRRM